MWVQSTLAGPICGRSGAISAFVRATNGESEEPLRFWSRLSATSVSRRLDHPRHDVRELGQVGDLGARATGPGRDLVETP